MPPSARLTGLALCVVASCAAGAAPAAAAPLPGNGRLAFVDTSTHSPSIGIANADGTARRQLTHTLPLMGQPAWSRQANLIALVLDGRVALMRPDGSGLRAIGDRTLPELAPQWSSTGELAFVRQRSVEGNAGMTLVVTRSDGGRQRVFSIPAAIAEPQSFAWSSDGHRVQWAVSRGGGSFNALTSLDVRSGRVTTAAQSASCATPPARAPHGPLSACARVNGHGRVELLRAGKVIAMTRPTTTDSVSPPVWNPQGTSVAYGIDDRHVAVLTPGSMRVRTYAVPLRASDSGATASWSPNGRRLVVGARAAAGWSIATLDVRAGSAVTVVAHAEDTAPRFSADGTLLAYVHESATGPLELRLLRGLQGPSRVLTRTIAPVAAGLELPANFSWAPDSSAIAYTTRGGALATIEVTAGTQRTLSRPAAGQPFWSPDGSTIAFTATSTRSRAPVAGPVGFVHADGSASQLATLAGPWLPLGWTPDGSGLFASGGSLGTAGIVDVATGAMTTSFGAAAGSGSALSPDGTSVLLTTDVSHGSIEYGTGIIYHGTPLPGTGLISLAPAVWSPDGSSIVYTLGQGVVRGRAGSELAVAPASEPGTLGAPIRNAGEPSWQPLPGF